MALDRALLREALAHGESESGNVEFKTRLSKDIHLAEGRFESLAAQLRHRILSGGGEAVYVVGVTDDGGLAGIDPDAFSESMDVLSLLAQEADARVAEVETDRVGDGLVGVATVVEGSVLAIDDDHLVVGTAGHVDHGKSTLVGTLITGRADDGDGETRAYLDTKPHEIDRGLSADISYAVYGFADDEAVRLDRPERREDRAAVVREADRVVSFVDTVGHDPWLRTTIRGLVGGKLDYGLLTVAADDGVTRTTREHLGILLATDLPTIVAVTKVDLVDDERLEAVTGEVERLLREVGRTPLLVARHGVEAAIEEIGDRVVPVVATSAVTLEGLDVLDRLFRDLPKRAGRDGAFRLYIDRTYTIAGVGPVASGTVRSGEVSAGDELLLGPFPDGRFEAVTVRSIEMHHHRVDRARAGQIVGIALKGIETDAVERGMALVPPAVDPTPVRAFEAEVVVLNHPTKITAGYEPVVHLETVSEAARFEPANRHLLPGDTGRTTVRFKFGPHLVEPGQRFVFREGKSKGVGTVLDVDPRRAS
ncbi:MAG: GTPBP1 family GTP-binding protein [Halobacteriales archaeon]